MKKKKNFQLIIIVALISLIVTFSYPFGKKLIGMLHTYSRPDTYGKEIIYSYINEGDVYVADKALENKYEISRFEPIEIDNITWKENPFSDVFWRFNFYNLEPVRNLLFAWEETEKPIYKDKLIEITNSFLDNGMDGPYSWDYHGVAFRTMTLINLRAKLKEKSELPLDLDEKIQAALKVHGDFLADPAHFEKEYNHGLDQAAALYLLAVNYPDMEGAKDWLKISSERIVIEVNGIIDGDGVLVENSPYYHFYVLEKLYEINKYLSQNNLKIKGFSSEEKLNQMVTYAVYMLQPDLNVPTIGASIKRNIGLGGIYKELAFSRPDLLYILSQGVYGLKPSKLNSQFPASGETIMRSGWGRKESFINQTQLIFDVGNYRTNHSDLDALSFNLYGNGVALMPDAGLYSYEPAPLRSYFHGTRAHNTVVVDGKDQDVGNKWSKSSVTPGMFKEGSGCVYQSGQSTLYEGVTHKRAISMIEDSTILIVDKLESSSEHTYEQMFHVFPGAKISSDGLTFTAKGSQPGQSLSIKQFITDNVELRTTIGNHNPPDGLCSFELNKVIPCAAVSYAQKGKDASYVTVISIGENKAKINYDRENNSVTVDTLKREYKININETQNSERNIEVNKKIDTEEIRPTFSLNDSLKTLNENGIDIITPSNGSVLDVYRKANLDLSSQNLFFNIKAENASKIQDIDISLSNNNWSSSARYNINHVFNFQNVNREGEWLQFGVSKNALRNSDFGGWVMDPNFSWSKVDGIKISASSLRGSRSTINLKDFALVSNQKDARAIIMFDDGWSSVMSAAQEMNKFGMKGNVGVIAGSIGKTNYLTLDELKTLQNNFGWSIANHSNLHKNATEQYEKNNDFTGLENDVSDALQYMIVNKINSAPNWYIYPDGSTDEAVKNVINKYYKFARATTAVAESFPFPEPLEVGIFPVNNGEVSPEDVHNAIDDAIKNKETVFLMFHKIINGNPTAPTEISLSDFKTILEDMNKQGIKVDTLSELDRENNVPETEFTLHTAIPSQISLDVSSSYMPINFNFIINKLWE